jgi:SAM-dependent methyltransferase
MSSTFVAADGDGYELQMGRWSRRLAPLFLDFAAIGSGGRVLDVGCGTGRLTEMLVARPGMTETHRVDVSEAYVAHARQRVASPKAAFSVADACAMPFETAHFDHALSQLVLQFVPESRQAIREMRRVTRPGGTVAATVWDSRGGFVAFRMFWDTAAMLDPEADARRGRLCTRPLSHPGGLGNAWRAAGLVDVTESELAIRMDFADFADFWSPFDGKDGSFAAYVSTLDPARRQVLKDAVRRAFLDGDPDGPRSYAATAWAVRGVVPG